MTTFLIGCFNVIGIIGIRVKAYHRENISLDTELIKVLKPFEISFALLKVNYCEVLTFHNAR